MAMLRQLRELASWHALFNAEGNVDRYGSRPYVLRGSPHQSNLFFL